MGKEKKLGSGGNGDSYGDDDEMGKEKKLGWQWRTMAIVRR